MDFRKVQNKGTIEEYVKYLMGFREQIINIEAPLTFTAIQTNLPHKAILWLVRR